MSSKSDGLPKVSYVPPIETKTLDNVPDGVWYLRGQIRDATGWGDPFSYKFKIDTQAPANFSISNLSSNDPTDPQPTLSWEANDSLSGIAKYELQVDQTPTFSLNPGENKNYKLPKQLPGQHNIVIKAFDQAGNTTTANATVVVKSIESPVLKIEQNKRKTSNKQPIIILGSVKQPYQVSLYASDVNHKNTDQQFLGSILGDDRNKNRGGTEIVLNANFQKNATSSEWQATLPPLKPGTYEIYARATDDRGAVSDPSNTVIIDVTGAGLSSILKLLNRAWQLALDFLVNKWLLVIIILAGLSLVILFIKRVVPALGQEFARIRFISREYSLSKDVRSANRKTRIELKMLTEDIKKELALLSKIANHRALHPDERYLKEKLEQYLKLLRVLR